MGEHLRQEDCDMLLKWCLMATQMETNNSSILAVDMSSTYSAAPAFTTWQRQRLDSILSHQQVQAPHIQAVWGNSNPMTTYWETMAANLARNSYRWHNNSSSNCNNQGRHKRRKEWSIPQEMEPRSWDGTASQKEIKFHMFGDCSKPQNDLKTINVISWRGWKHGQKIRASKYLRACNSRCNKWRTLLNSN